MAKEKKTISLSRAANKEDATKQLSEALLDIEKAYGKGSIMKLGEDVEMNVEVLRTGCLAIDAALGVGGLPRGRIVEIYGPESSGKTTVALHVIAETQKNGGICAFIDAEHALDPVYARNLGVDVDELYVSQPDNGEQGLEIAETLVKSGAIDVIVIDSVAALTPRAEIEGNMGDSHMGLQARLMSQALRKLASAASKTKTLIIFINQLREKVGVMFGSPEVTPGGKALKFYASVRIDVRKGEPVKDGKDMTGNRTRAKIVKNKLAPPFRTAEFDVIFGKGISAIGCLIDVGSEIGIIEKSGSWYAYNGEKIGQGKDNVTNYLTEKPEILEEIDKKVREEIFGTSKVANLSYKPNLSFDDED